MRKDLRLGLGIGALALVFAVTFLVVRNHTQSQLEEPRDSAQATAEGVTAGPPGANVPAATGGGAPISTVILPPLQPVKPPTPRATPDAIAQKPLVTTPVVGKSSWDALLSEGRPPGPISSSTINRTPAPSVTADPFNQVTHVEPPAARPSSATGQLSTMTGRPYTIRQGDTFSSVAKQQYGAEKYYLQIEQANPNVNTMRLKPGQQIILPELAIDTRSAKPRTGPFDNEIDNRRVNERTEYRVDTGDSLYRISMRLYGHPRMTDAIYEMNRSAIGANPDRLRLGMILRLPAVPEGK